MSENANQIKAIFDNKYKNVDQSNIKDLYSKWASTYEEDTTKKDDGYRGFIMLAKVVDLFAANNDVKILDIGAGTGLVAVHLKERDYHNIDGLDPSEDMLKIAKERNLYKSYFCEFVSIDKDDHKHGKYDVVTCAGGFSRGHMNYKHIEGLVKYAKINGIVSFCFRYEAIFDYQKEVPIELKRLEKEGFIEIITSTNAPNYYRSIDGYLAIVRRLK